MGRQRAHRIQSQLEESPISFKVSKFEVPEPHVARPEVTLPDRYEPSPQDLRTAEREADRARRKAASYMRRSQEAVERGDHRDAYVWSARAILAEHRAQAYQLLSERSRK